MGRGIAVSRAVRTVNRGILPAGWAGGRHQVGPSTPALGQGRQVAADEGGVAQGGGVVEEGPLGFGGLEHEQHQGLESPVVALGVLRLEVAPVPAQAVRHALRRDGATLDLHEAPVPVALVTQLERGVGMKDEVLVVGGVVGDLRAVGRGGGRATRSRGRARPRR